MSGYPVATASWLTLSAILAGVVAFEISDDVHLAPTVTAAPIERMAADVVELNPATVIVPSPDALDDIVDRPLFSVSRRPFEPMIDQQPLTAAAPDIDVPLQLVGTMLAEASDMVLLKHPTRGLLRLREGQTVDGWKVGEIDQNAVELWRGEEVEWLRLRMDSPTLKRQGKALSNPRKQGHASREETAAARPQTAGEKQPAAK